jgi:hypothetical protein
LRNGVEKKLVESWKCLLEKEERGKEWRGRGVGGG